jgi:tyrosyl-tRNA synthetase
MYGKALSIPDNMIYSWFELVTDVTIEKLAELKTRIPNDPRNTKHELAWDLTRMYHGGDAADAARAHFEQTVIKKEIPDDIPEIRLTVGSHGLIGVIRDHGLAPSGGEARRLVQQGGVSIDGETVVDPNHDLVVIADASIILKVGKRRYARIVS